MANISPFLKERLQNRLKYAEEPLKAADGMPSELSQALDLSRLLARVLIEVLAKDKSMAVLVGSLQRFLTVQTKWERSQPSFEEMQRRHSWH